MKFVFVIGCLLLSAPGFCRVLIVGARETFKTLRTAVQDAKNGDTILVRKGLYYINNLQVTKSITIIGEDYPTLHGSDKYELMTISGRGMKIKGFVFTHSGYSSMKDLAAITIIDASHFTIENNRFNQTYFGIHVANSHHFTVKDNRLHGVTKTEQTTGNGIHLWKCANAVIANNTSAGHRDGIYFEFVTNSTITGNTSHDNIRYGLHFMFSNNNTYSGNTFRGNGAGVAVMFSRNVNMTANTFEYNWGPSAYGILLKEINDSKITGNVFLQNTVAVFLEGSNRIEIANNTFRGNGWASRVQANCADNSFHHNNFLSNTFDIATNGSLVLNRFEFNYWDKYDGYDLNRDGIGDVPYRPISMYSMMVEKNPNSLMLLRSFMVNLLDKAEKAIPSLTPENLRDDKPAMKKFRL